MEYYIYSVPMFVVNPPEESVDLGAFCTEIEEILPYQILNDVEVVYVGKFDALNGRNAAFNNGAIYMTSSEPTVPDMIENFIHEVAHSLEIPYGMNIYTDDLEREFLGKRSRLYHLLEAEGFYIDPKYYGFTEYNEKFDNFLATEVGYPTLLNLTMGLFVSPYGATSLQEYFANGFEKYFLDDRARVRTVSPILYQKIEEIVNNV